MSLSPPPPRNILVMNQEVNCAKFSNLIISAVKICKQCLQIVLASEGRSRCPPLWDFRPHTTWVIAALPLPLDPNENSWSCHWSLLLQRLRVFHRLYATSWTNIFTAHSNYITTGMTQRYAVLPSTSKLTQFYFVFYEERWQPDTVHQTAAQVIFTQVFKSAPPRCISISVTAVC